MPPILSTSHCELYGNHSCGHARKPSPWHLFTRLLNKYSTFNVSRIVDSKSFDIHYLSFPHVPYKHLPPNKSILGTHRFSLFLLSFSLHTFLWACGSSCEPRKYFSIIFLCSLITHSFLNGFQPNLYQHFSHVCSTCLAIFSMK